MLGPGRLNRSEQERENAQAEVAVLQKQLARVEAVAQASDHRRTELETRFTLLANELRGKSTDLNQSSSDVARLTEQVTHAGERHRQATAMLAEGDCSIAS